jgi:hypothetical protein
MNPFMATISCNDTHFPSCASMQLQAVPLIDFYLCTRWLSNRCHRHKRQLESCTLVWGKFFFRKKNEATNACGEQVTADSLFCIPCNQIPSLKYALSLNFISFCKRRRVESFFVRPSKSDRNHAQNNNHATTTSLSQKKVFFPQVVLQCNLFCFHFPSSRHR